MYHNMSESEFDQLIADLVLGRVDRLRLVQVCELYGVPNREQWAAVKELAACDVRLRLCRSTAVAALATSM